FDLVCVNAWMLDLTQAILNLGFLTGAFTLGYAADRYGRIVIYLISCFGVGITGVVVAFAPNFPVFVVFRFLQGVFGKGTWITCYVIGITQKSLLLSRVVPESPRWLITRKKGDKALKILRSIAKCNGKYLSPNYSEVIFFITSNKYC
ncbi:hypothetical protein HPG69_010932, partial [Diceros bicornis minor]